ncbi:uncharacterized protein BNAC02G41020D isoform X1 [Brassica napus]|uniref:uncharacterized protein BNAC02G41020D isoform X1 n=1 Tax=Brassica napus TaxID=3708 RepID=UPI002078539D|nr:uncharacterized protein BNAC02G41020D isoform X1 [Brassica napus]XP_048604290.1 uncharacterized protein BNAC02G41020D isoform X1 [Brassica napus]XP_048604291.1 uncharacterized protein BNAC02G41020D isoform X1 [Brassica napus]XP_048604292.1 uncharacterized protein BNAC02G41020D isoform X1 [Brassica napus]XP_048604293.1 uncharacterized protein BNAC02G41020D isoform X1 [Brassica napus]XP_048604294.1 uncharacterized protein BNAC02G41020D isoform X1 [Brassica napus]XP_048604295.1 uncharacterize
MGEATEMKLKIHFGGSMKKDGEGYVYVGETGTKNVEWKIDEITWERFSLFCKEDSLIRAPIGLLWFKFEKEEMKDLRYAYDYLDEEMRILRSAGKLGVDVVEVFVEHIPNTKQDERSCSDEDEDVDRPKEDDEPEESKDENPTIQDIPAEIMTGNEAATGENQNENDDVGDELVVDAADGGSDSRFKSIFDEGMKAIPDKEAYGEGINEEEKDDDSEDERAPVDVEYPDTPVDSEDEWEGWNRERRGKGKVKEKDKYHGDYEKPPYIWLFQKFNSGLEFKDQLLKYSMNTQYDVKMAKSESWRIAVVCSNEKCKFRVYCSVEKPINRWMVKVCHMKHNHGKSSRISMLKQGVIAGLFREELRRNVNLPTSAIKDAIKERYDIVVPIGKCYRGRHIALGTILEAQTTQFGKLWDYEAELHRSNGGISTELCTREANGVQMFDCFYICFKELRESWKSCCRPVIGLDGCFLKWDLNGDLLAAVGRDADNRMFPIAWAVVRGENKDTWGWFVKKLKMDLDLGNGKDLTIISDKKKGLVHAIQLELPDAEHRMCARHIYANWKKLGFARSEFKSLFWGVAYSYTEGEYEEKLNLLEAYNVVAHQELLKTDPKRWCRAYFRVDSHCPDVHNNLSESFNRTIKMARAKPVITMLEDIRRQAMKRNSRWWFMADKWDTIVTPITLALLEKARIAKKYCLTLRSSSSLYEVNECDNGYTVNLATHQCACRRWDLTGIPCKHAVCVFDDNQEDPVKYTSEYYYTHKMKKTYNENIKPVNGENLWKRLGKPSIGIPELRKSRGRPRTRERGEKSHLKTLKTLENRQDTDVCPNVAVAFRWVTLKVVAKMNKWFMRVQRTNVDDLVYIQWVRLSLLQQEEKEQALLNLFKLLNHPLRYQLTLLLHSHQFHPLIQSLMPRKLQEDLL